MSEAQAPAPAKSGAELEKAIEANVEAQDYQEETVPVNAQVIKAEPAALIASGTGDISTTGASSEAPLTTHFLFILSGSSTTPGDSVCMSS